MAEITLTKEDQANVLLGIISDANYIEIFIPGQGLINPKELTYFKDASKDIRENAIEFYKQCKEITKEDNTPIINLPPPKLEIDIEE